MCRSRGEARRGVRRGSDRTDQRDESENRARQGSRPSDPQAAMTYRRDRGGMRDGRASLARHSFNYSFSFRSLLQDLRTCLTSTREIAHERHPVSTHSADIADAGALRAHETHAPLSSRSPRFTLQHPIPRLQSPRIPRTSHSHTFTLLPYRTRRHYTAHLTESLNLTMLPRSAPSNHVDSVRNDTRQLADARSSS